jgi:hypothetical protein
MPHFTLQLLPEGAIITALVGVSSARAQALKETGQESPKMFRARALIDTGASCTCVDPSILKDALKLSPTGNTSINTPSTGNSPATADQYDIGLIIPAANVDEAPLYVGTLPVICSEFLQSQGFHALIGRDVLATCIFSYNGETKLFTLAY